MGHQSKNCNVDLLLDMPTDAFTSLAKHPHGTKDNRTSRSSFTEQLVVSFPSSDDFPMAGQHEMEAQVGTNFVWNSVMPLRAPSQRSEAVSEDTN